MTDDIKEKKKMLSRKSPEVLEYRKMVEKAKRDAEVVTLREWYDSTRNHQQEIIDYMEAYKQLGPLGKELHKRGVKRITERFGDNVRTLVEATYQRGVLNMAAPLCAFVCTSNKNK
jgi:putative IMPACT (imprinted ancient) family translation regulator